MLKKPIVKKLLGATIVLFLFIGYLQYNSYTETHFKVNQTAFSSVLSWNDFIKLEAEQVPGLALADHYHLMKSVSHLINVTSLRRDIRIEKVWLTDGRLYLVYSMNLKKTDKTIEELPRLTIKTVSFHTKQGKEIETKVLPMLENQLINYGHVIGHRVYRGLYYNFRENSNRSSVKQNQSFYKDVFSQVDAMTMKNVSLVTDKENHHSSLPLQNFNIPVTFISSSKLVDTVPINSTYTLKPGIKMRIKQAQLYVYGTHINYDLINNLGTPISMIQMNYYDTNRPYERNITMTSSANHQFSIKPISYFPYTFEVEPKSYIYQSRESFDFSVTNQQIKKMMVHTPTQQVQFIGHLHSWEAYFGIPTDEVDSNQQIDITLRINTPDLQKTSPYLRRYIPLVKPSLSQKHNNSSDNRFPAFHEISSIHSTLRIMKGKNKDFTTTKLINMQVRPKETTFILKIDKKELLTAQYMRFVISPLFYSDSFSDETPFKVTIKDKTNE